MAAFLTVSKIGTPVSNLDELINQFRIQLVKSIDINKTWIFNLRYGPIENSDAESYFKNMAYVEGRMYE